MNLDELRSVQDEERETGSLQPLRPSFYTEARGYIDELKAERDRHAQASDEPFADPEVNQLSDRLDTATGVLESIFENRMAKLLRHAATVAAGSEDDPPEMTTEEAALYDTLVSAIKSTKVAALEGDHQALPTDEETAHTPAVEQEDATEDEEETDEASSDEREDIERLTVRITADIGRILGIDEREYDLQRGDVVSLPAENARALIEREAAAAVDD